MKIFLGSSKESLNDLRAIASWLEEAKHEPLPWDEPQLFLPGDNTFSRLIEISKQVDAAVFVFAEDDKIWYRQDAAIQPRDNVLIEYGLFAGALGQKRAVVCRKGAAKYPTDLQGIVRIELDQIQRARISLLAWIRKLETQKEDLDVSDLEMQRALFRRELEETREQLQFEQQKSRDLQELLANKGLVDFNLYDFSSNAHWKLLFDYDYFWQVVDLAWKFFTTPGDLQAGLQEYGLSAIASKIQWNLGDQLRTRFYVAKVLRVLRRSDERSYLNFLAHTGKTLRESIDSVGRQRAEALRSGPRESEADG